MSLEKQEKPKVENVYRMYFRKLSSRKIVYKDIYAFSHEEAKEKAKDYIENTRKELKLLSVK